MVRAESSRTPNPKTGPRSLISPGWQAKIWKASGLQKDTGHGKPLSAGETTSKAKSVGYVVLVRPKSAGDRYLLPYPIPDTFFFLLLRVTTVADCLRWRSVRCLGLRHPRYRDRRMNATLYRFRKCHSPSVISSPYQYQACWNRSSSGIASPYNVIDQCPCFRPVSDSSPLAQNSPSL